MSSPPPAGRGGERSLVLPILVLLIAMVCFQVGAALAKTLIPTVGASGAAALRLLYATVMLWLIWRPWRRLPSAAAAAPFAVYGIALGCMNLMFYAALRTIPLGIAVALEITGPLAVAMSASRRGLDLLWVASAAAGLLLLLPFSPARHGLDPAGAAFALGAGACWALYIVFGRRAGLQGGVQATAIGMLIGAIVVVPIGAVHAGAALFSPSILPAALGVALLSSALPYPLEMYGLTRIPTRTFGVLMSMGPALAALSGWCLLGERLDALQWLAVGCVVLASAGSAATSRR